MTMFMLGFTDRRRQGIGFIGFYVFCALATLTKSPMGLLIPQIAVILFLLYQRQINFLKTWVVPIGILVCLIIALPWYVYIYNQYGHAFIHEFFYNDHWRRLLVAEHHGNDHWYFYPMTMIAGLFPWSLFLLAAWVDLFKRLKSPLPVLDYLSLSWILAFLIVFQMAHSKLASYILPLFPALALMTGNFLGNGTSQIQHRKKMQNLLCASFVLLAVLGIAVMAGQKVYRHYISSPLPAYFLSGSLIALSGIGITLAFKERFQAALYVLALSLCPLFLTAFMVRTDVEGYTSSHEASEYIPQRSWGAMTVLTSKANARGIRYYTGQDVAVVDFSGKPFFSPHPVPILDTTDKIMSVLGDQRMTLGVVRKSVYQYILKNCAYRYHVELLRIIGYDYIVRIEATALR
jgi:4-amino-4-deoxy-L-arabinose transferase-like glycosyltransferase